MSVLDREMSQCYEKKILVSEQVVYFLLLVYYTRKKLVQRRNPGSPSRGSEPRSYEKLGPKSRAARLN